MLILDVVKDIGPVMIGVGREAAYVVMTGVLHRSPESELTLLMVQC